MPTGTRFFSLLTKGPFLSLAVVVLAFSLGYGLAVKSMPFSNSRDLPGTLAVPILEVHIARQFSSSPEKIWSALTDPQTLACWWAPPGYTVQSVRFEARPEGEYEIRFKDPHHGEHVTRGQVLVFNPIRRLKMTEVDFDVEGDELVPEFEGQAVTIEQTLMPSGLGTKLDIHVTGPFPEELVPMIETSWNLALEKLEVCDGSRHEDEEPQHQ